MKRQGILKFLCIILGVLGLLLVGCKSEEPMVVQEADAEMIIVAVGDSLTAGYGVAEEASYPALLEEKLHEAGYTGSRVVNAGVSAETSSGTRSRMEWILSLEPDIIILETGANDGLRGIDPALVEQNIRAILDLLKEKQITVILAGMKMVWNLGPVYVAQFNSIYPRLADDYNLIFFPFFLEDVAMQRQLNLADGLHPNPEGYKLITENLFPYVEQAIKKRETLTGQ